MASKFKRQGCDDRSTTSEGKSSGSGAKKKGEVAASTSTGENPMLNPVILEALFQVCELKDLRRYRVVCRAWHELSLSRWRNEMTIIIACNDYFTDFTFGDGGRAGRARLHWKDASILYGAPTFTAKPFRKFRLMNWEFPNPEPERDTSIKRITRETLDSFWSHCGPWMKELELCYPKIKCELTFRKVITELTPNLVSLKLDNMSPFELGDDVEEEPVTQPNLKYLSISLQHICWEMMYFDLGEPEMPIPWLGLFLCFPNLEELEWKEFQDFSGRELIDAWDTLRRNRKHSQRTLKIKCENINREEFGCNLEVLKAFIEYPHFTFRTMHIELNENIEDTFLWRTWELHHNTLSTLDLCSPNSIIRTPFPAMQLPFLSSLNLKGNFLADLHFLEHTPNLRALTLVAENLEAVLLFATSFERMRSIQLLKLISLKVDTTDLSTDNYFCSVLPIFFNSMPNIMELKYPLSKWTFRLACQYWKGLRELEDLYRPGILDDEAITGIEGEGSRFPNITDLKYLRQFKTRSCELSGKSVWKGFLESESLTALRVCLHKKTTNKSFSALCSRFRGGVSRDKSSNPGKQDLNDKMKRRGQKMCKNYGICFSGNH